MASLLASMADAVAYFQQHGIYYLEDATIGMVVKEVDDQGLSRNLDSWRYFEDLVLGNTRLRSILEPFLHQTNPQICYTFGPEPGRFFCFLPQAGLSHRMLVSMWSAGTKLELMEGSHIGPLKAVQASNGLFEVPAKKGSPIQLDEGGIAILDVRFVLQRKAGFTILYGMEKE
ncbi:hypothetical protein B0T22DRAFT_461147 [Podospora appendiculata]|uniref:Uncharacterized protein n=1 Tax=Podospora appendiculata TaxID=314037 RepID=A0AAE1CD56_9PEZI|nr:hypothetical protein B0T22DRAFT_461147 [Podospora appendiculata]